MTKPDLFDNVCIVPDNDDLASRASRLMVRMCGVVPPLPMVNPILDAIFEAIQNSPVNYHFSRVTGS